MQDDERQSPWDRLGKGILEVGLSGAGEVKTQTEVSSAAQYVDATFEPDARHPIVAPSLGLLGRMTNERCLIELFHEPPSLTEVLRCVQKQLMHHQRELARARRERRPAATAHARLWIVSAGRPGSAVFELGLKPLFRWPLGFYGVAESWRVRLVVVNELPRSRASLLLRLLGSPAVVRDALEELQALPDDAEERTIALPVLAEVRLTTMARIGVRSPLEEEELLMKMSPIYEAWKERVEREGLERGLAQGLERGLERGLEQGLERGIEQGLEQGLEQGVRGLRAAIVAFFEGRFGPMPEDVRAAVDGMRDVATLTTWSTRLATADRDAVLQMMRAGRA